MELSPSTQFFSSNKSIPDYPDSWTRVRAITTTCLRQRWDHFAGIQGVMGVFPTPLLPPKLDPVCPIWGKRVQSLPSAVNDTDEVIFKGGRGETPGESLKWNPCMQACPNLEGGGKYLVGHWQCHKWHRWGVIWEKGGVMNDPSFKLSPECASLVTNIKCHYSLGKWRGIMCIFYSPLFPLKLDPVLPSLEPMSRY